MTDLMIILGSPASGKTTLARRLARETGLPVLGKDDVKEALFDVLGVADRRVSARLSEVSFAAVLRLAERQLSVGVSCFIEGNFRAAHAAAVRGLLAATDARAAQIWCHANPCEIERRFTSRVRHAGHLDHATPADEVRRKSELPPSYLDIAGPRWAYDSQDAAAADGLLRTLQSWRV